MVRMYNEGAARKSSGRNITAKRGYRNIADALWRISREEGVSGLWRGATPTIVRSMVVNCVQLGTYDAAKEKIIRRSHFEDGVGVHLAASTISGFCYSVATLPIDSAKTRMQNQHINPDGTFPYRNLFHAIVKVGQEEGLLALWRGFTPYFSRCAGKSSLYRSLYLSFIFEKPNPDVTFLLHPSLNRSYRCNVFGFGAGKKSFVVFCRDS